MNYKLAKTLTVASMVVAVSMAQVAEAKRDFGAIYIECGLGALIAPSTGWVAVITNITWDLGTTAIMSEASSPESCKGGQARTAMMIYEAYPSLETELAQGRGEHLDALFVLAGRDKGERSALIAELRSGFATVVAEPGYTERSRYEKAARFYDLFQAAIADDAKTS